MLSKKYKLTALEIKDLFNKKRRSFFSFKIIRNNFFDVKIFSNKEIKENKYAVILSSKDFKKAVERNNIKRVVYSIIEDIVKKEEKKSCFVLIYPKKDIKDVEFLLLKKEMYNVLNSNLL